MKMRTPRHSLPLAAFTLGLLLAVPAQAALFDRGGGLIYDDVLNITWLKDANYAKTTRYDSNGLMKWNVAKTWADNLSFHDSVRNVNYSDWRLPTALNQDGTGPCSNYYSCNGSEMGHMYYVNLGASAMGGIWAGTNTTNLALFTNLQSYVYWSGTAKASPPSGQAWSFNNAAGSQYSDIQDKEYYAWAVRPGDVAAVPEPEAYALLMAGLGLLGVVAKRRRQYP